MLYKAACLKAGLERVKLNLLCMGNLVAGTSDAYVLVSASKILFAGGWTTGKTARCEIVV